MIKKNCQNIMKHKKTIKKLHFMLIAGQYRSTSKNIIFSNLNFTKFFVSIFVSILDHFQMIKDSGFEPLRSGGGSTRTLVVRPLTKNIFFDLPKAKTPVKQTVIIQTKIF